MATNKNTKRHRYIGISLVVLNCMTFLIAIAVMAFGVPNPGTVTITSPGPSSLIESPNFTVTGTATPNKQIQVYLNNAFVGQTTSSSNGDWNVNVTGVKNGQINLYAKISEDPFLYVTHTAGPKTLTQIDTATNSVTSTIPGGIKQPRRIIHHPTQARAYIYSSGTYTIKVINSDNYETVSDIENVGSNVTKLLMTPDGSKLIVASNGVGGNIKIFSTADNSLLQTISSASYDIALTPDGSKLYSAASSNKLKGWSMTDYSTLADINLAYSSSNIAVNPSGTKLYAIEAISSQIEVISLASGTVTNTIATPGEQPQSIVVSPAGDIAVVESNTQKILNLSNETYGTVFGGGLSQGPVVFNSTGSTAYYSNSVTKVVDISTNTVIGTNIKNGYGGLALTPDNSRLIAADNSTSDINIIDADTAPYNAITTKTYPQLENFVTLTADGTKAYASSINTGRIFVVNTVTNAIESTIDSDQLFGCHPYQTVLNKTETKLYVTASDCAAILIIDTETNQFQSYFEVDGSNFIELSKDGSKLYIASHENVIIYDIASGIITDTINIGANPAFALTLTPDESKLYVSDPGNDRVIVVNTATKSVVTNIPVESDVYAISSNPAGTIIYASTPMTNHYTKISTVSDSVIGSSITTDAFPTSVNFLPDGSKMYVVTGGSKINVIDPSTDNKISDISISSGAYIFNGGLLRKRVINTATQNIFINAPELGELKTVPAGYTPLFVNNSGEQVASTTAAVGSSPVTAGEPSAQSSGVSSSQGNNSDASNFFTNIPSSIIEAIKATPASVARVFPWLLFTLLLSVAGVLMLQVFLEYRNIKKTITLANRERSLRAEKKNFLALSAHYLRTPLTTIQTGLELINFKNKKHEADGALNITKILAGEIENVLQKLQEEQEVEPKLKTVEFKNMGLHALASPAFLVPAILIGILAISANILFINVARLDLGVINLITQAMFFIAAVMIFYFVIRTFIISRARHRAAQALLDDEKSLSHARNQVITDTSKILEQELQHLSASIGAIKVKDQKPLLDVAAGIKSFEQTLAKFELVASLKSGELHLDHSDQVNLAKLVNSSRHARKSEISSKQIELESQISSLGNITTDSKSISYVIDTVIDNAIKYSPEKSTISVAGNRTALGYKLTITDQGTGINKGQLQQLFKPFSRVDNAMVFEKQGMGLSLYLDRLIMHALGGDISVNSTAGHGTSVTLLLP